MKKYDYSAVYGHGRICTGLRQAVKTERTVSAYLFSGAHGVGKKTVAGVFAATLLCDSPKEGEPCQLCQSCRLMKVESHPDFIRLSPPADKKTIGVDVVREQIIKEAYIRPFTSAKKVFLVDQADTMTIEAQNALLKVLEEPPEYAVFLLLSKDQNLLLETVRSRCLKLRFLPLEKSLVESYFTAHAAPSERKALAIAFAQGVIGRGHKILTDDEFHDLYQSTLDHLEATACRTSALVELQQFFTAHKERIEEIVDFMTIFLRDCLHLSVSGSKSLICADRAEAVMRFSEAVTCAGLIRLTEAVMQFGERLQKNASFTAAGLELLIKMQEEIHVKGSRNPI